MATTKGSRMHFLSSTGLHQKPELWYQQQPLAPIHLLGECRQIWVSLSWFLNLRIGWDSEFYLVVEQVTCLLPAGKILERARVKYPGYTHSWFRHWLGLCWKILRNFHTVERYWMGDLLKDAREYPSSEKALGQRASIEKKLRNIQGSAERCRGCSVIGNWAVLAGWLGKRLIWHFPSVRLPL